MRKLSLSSQNLSNLAQAHTCCRHLKQAEPHPSEQGLFYLHYQHERETCYHLASQTWAASVLPSGIWPGKEENLSHIQIQAFVISFLFFFFLSTIDLYIILIIFTSPLFWVQYSSVEEIRCLLCLLPSWLVSGSLTGRKQI